MKTLHHMRPHALFAATALTLAASGCSVTPMEVRERSAQKTDEIIAATALASTQRRLEPSWLRIPGNYLGSSPRPIDTTTNLPPQYRDITLNFGEDAQGTLTQVVSNIRSKIGLNVRINADVIPPTTGAAGNPTAAPVPLPMSTAPLPAGTTAAPGQILPSAQALASASFIQPLNVSALASKLPLTHDGQTAEYLDRITSILGVSWEYSNNEVYIYRYLTRRFNLAVSPGTVSYEDNMSGGGTTTGGGNAQFGSTSTTKASALLNPWQAADAAIKTMLTSGGKVSINETTGTVSVTDTKEVVNRVEKYIQHENGLLRAQVTVDIREITVQLDDRSELGLDLNLLYRKLNASTGNPDWTFQMDAPATLTSSSSGNATFNVIKPNAYWAGSSAAIQALNSVGHVVSDNTDSVVTINRVPGRTQSFVNRSFLASTTPATGGGTSGGVGVPGLTPGVVTYGVNLAVIPTITDDNTVILQMFDTRSNLIDFATISTGSGQTLQQLQLPTTGTKKNSPTFNKR